MIPRIDAGTSTAATPCAEVSGPGQLYFSVPIAGPTGSAGIAAPAGWPPLAGHLPSQSRSGKPRKAGRVIWLAGTTSSGQLRDAPVSLCLVAGQQAGAK